MRGGPALLNLNYRRRAPAPVKVYTVGTKSFVASFQLAGVPGRVSPTPEKAIDSIRELASDPDVGLVLVGDDVAGPISDEMTRVRASTKALVFALPAAGGKKTDVDYRAMLKSILGV